MKKQFLGKALALFERFKTHKITSGDLEEAEQKAKKFGCSKGRFSIVDSNV